MYKYQGLSFSNKIVNICFHYPVINSIKITGTKKIDLLLMQRWFNVWILTSAFGSLDKLTKSTN